MVNQRCSLLITSRLSWWIECWRFLLAQLLGDVIQTHTFTRTASDWTFRFRPWPITNKKRLYYWIKLCIYTGNFLGNWYTFSMDSPYHTIYQYLREPLSHVIGVTAVTTRLTPREPISERRQNTLSISTWSHKYSCTYKTSIEIKSNCIFAYYYFVLHQNIRHIIICDVMTLNYDQKCCWC